MSEKENESNVENKEDEMKEYFEKKFDKLVIEAIEPITKYFRGQPFTYKPYVFASLAFQQALQEALLPIIDIMEEFFDPLERIADKVSPRGRGRPKREGRFYKLVDEYREKFKLR